MKLKAKKKNILETRMRQNDVLSIAVPIKDLYATRLFDKFRLFAVVLIVFDR